MRLPGSTASEEDLVISRAEQGEERSDIHECLRQLFSSTRFGTLLELQEERVQEGSVHGVPVSRFAWQIFDAPGYPDERHSRRSVVGCQVC